MLTLLLLFASASSDWSEAAARDEIKPRFRRSEQALLIEADGRPGLNGFWQRTYPVQGGSYYHVSVRRRTTGIESPAQCTPVRVVWLNAAGQRVPESRPQVTGVLENHRPTVGAEYPVDGPVGSDGWAVVEGTYLAPAAARQALVELHLQWATAGRVEWRNAAFAAVEKPAPRKARLATIHLQPRQGTTAQEKREQYAGLIARAAEQKADLVVLGETLTYYGSGRTPGETAEPIPGPSSTYFAELARKHGLYIVAGLFEREGRAVYNSAILAAPDGTLAGKYRKVALPESEIEAGVTPGLEYPVFDTRFGRLGIMICYDGFFPEVARELTKRGAEVIAWPVWGVNPELARARAAENHVYLVSSTYEPVSSQWGYSAVWDHAGRTIAKAQDWGTVVLAEVDLAEPTRWKYLGDFRQRIPRHLPLAK